MNLEDSLKKLYSLHSFGIKLGLENIRKFLAVLGNPEKNLKTFHIAGSNGKGSTAAFTASILKELKYKTGLYTSPHFVRFNERIKINGEEISDEYIAKFINKNNDYIDIFNLTFFEVTTALAFKYFFENEIDYAVIETGLGGRLDATNVLSPLAVIITSVSLEHTNILGSNIAQITGEKAAIIKSNSRVFTGRLPDEAEIIIEKKCLETKSELFKIEDYTNENENSLELYTEEIELDDWTMPLKGDYQKYNAALAGLAVAKTLDVSDFNLISAGIRNVINNTGIQGRYEYYKTGPDIIFDSAHNPESVLNFLSEFKKDHKKYSKKVLLFGVMRDKAINEMLFLLKDYFDEIHVTEAGNERTAKINDLTAAAETLKINVFPENKPSDFILKFFNEDKNNCLVILGSMYLIGDIKSSLILNKIS